MKKQLWIGIITVAVSAAMSISAFAGTWKQETAGWKYDNGDGTCQQGGWFTDTDGKQYYFDANGYMLSNTTTPDGYQVGADGAWIHANQSADTSAYNLCGWYASGEESIWVQLSDVNVMNVNVYRQWEDEFTFQPGNLTYTVWNGTHTLQFAADGSSLTLDGTVYKKTAPGHQQYNANNGVYKLAQFHWEVVYNWGEKTVNDETVEASLANYLSLFYETDGTIAMYTYGHHSYDDNWNAHVDQATMTGISGDHDGNVRSTWDGSYFTAGDSVTIVDDNTIVLRYKGHWAGDYGGDVEVTETYKR
ncbi:MAG: hypothetical protein PHV18_05700 [Lachnospiraceae bacterium]|nr:hypothetical protein [Lachnospiraceae bacterium]